MFFSHRHCGLPFGALDFAPHPVVFCLLVVMFSSCLLFPIGNACDATPSSSTFWQSWSPLFEQLICDSDCAFKPRYLRSLIYFSTLQVTCTIAPFQLFRDWNVQCTIKFIIDAPSVTQFFLRWSSTTPLCVTRSPTCNSMYDRQLSPFMFCCARPSHIPWDKLIRVGEATNPGPNISVHDAVHIPEDAFQFGLINPTGLHQKAELVASLGKGVWAVAESRVTHKSRSLLRHEFKSLQFYTDFCDPVPPCSKKRSDVYKGIAAGVACISSFPIRNVSCDIPQHIRDSYRLVPTHVSLGPHTTLLVITIYAPPPNNQTIEDPNALTADLISAACDMIHAWRGPGIIAGDFNQDICDFAPIQHLFSIGWKDAQEHSVQKFCHSKKPTCITAQGQSCHSKILCSPTVATSIYYCNAVDDHLFANHPTLIMFCDLKCFASPKLQWHLPKPFQCQKFDRQILDELQPNDSDQSEIDFTRHIAQRDVEAAAKVWVQQTEKVLSVSARDANNHPIKFSSNHFGRHIGPKIKHQNTSVPVLRWARPGEMNSINTQAPTWFRQHLKQGRRLNTLVCLLRSRLQHPTLENQQTCDALWKAIAGAEGFRGKFPQWCVLNLGCPFPLMTPNLEQCQDIAGCFQKYFQKLDAGLKTQKQNDLKKRTDLDWKNGGSLAFASMKEEGPVPTAYIARTIQAPMKRVRWDKKGKTILPCTLAINFVVGSPVIFQGQSAFVIDNQEGYLTVDRPLFLRSNNFVIKQKHIYYDTNSATQEVVNAWNSFLQRDQHDLVDQWTEAEQIVSTIPQQETIQISDYNVDLWRRTQSKTPLKSARGSCGFAVGEMRCLPAWCLERLFQLFRVIDETSMWPAMWLYAFTIMLPKVSVPESPLDLRPITILSRIYRQWSRFKAVALLVGLSSKIPSTIAGGTATSSLMLSAYLQEVLETETKGSECNGITIDIIKCYNVIPRYPLSLTMYKMGWPDDVIKTYMAALMNLQRSFHVLGSVSPWQRSYTGVPEGCALAVSAMLTLSSSLYYFLHEQCPQAEVFTFADNWALLFRQWIHTDPGVRQLERFCSALKLSISVPKSWMWALETSVLNKLGTIMLQGSAIPIIKHTKDLGVDLTYQGVRKKTHLRHRLKLGLQRCRKVPAVLCPKEKQDHLLHMSCFPKAGFGVELSQPTQKEFNSFRSAAARALGLSRKGASPWIALSLLGKNNDFQYFAMRRTVFFWRQYAARFPDRTSYIIHKLQTPDNKGPIANLRNVLQRVGLSFIGELVCSEFYGDVPWLKCSKRFMNLVLHTHWVHFVCSKLTGLQRKHFHGTFIDTIGHRRNLAKFNRTDQQMLRAHSSGTNYTNNARSKYLDVQDICPFCGHVDSRSHRILDCSGLVEERQQVSAETLVLLRNSPTFRHFGLITVDPQHTAIRQEFPANVSWYDLERQFGNQPNSENQEYHLFTDGSCFHNGDPLLAIAAAAVVVFRNFLQPLQDFHTRALLPGQDHSSYRAEIFAFYLCCVQFTKGIIYSDCQSAIDGFEYVLQCIARNVVPNFHDHIDLWNEIYRVANRKRCSFRLVKVKAHNEHVHNPTHDLWWKSQANAEADLQAKNAITVDNKVLFDKLVHLFHFQNKNRISLAEVMSFQVSAAWKSIHLNRVKNSDDIEPSVFGKGIVPEHVSRWNNNLLEGQSQACKFNPTFLYRLARWANTVQWDRDSTSHTATIELMLAYIFSTKSLPPFPIQRFHNDSSRAKIWLLKDLNPTKDFQNYHIGHLLSGFVRTINWCSKHLGIELFPGIKKPDVCSLTRYGFRGKAAGYKARAALPAQDLIDSYCNQYFPNQKVFSSPIPYATT